MERNGVIIMKLYVIGNGFDLAHELHTSYSDYKRHIENNLKNHPNWHIILDFYPNYYNFWSDIEKNVCAFNGELFLKLKECYGSGFLDDLLKQIRDSFQSFIYNCEKDVVKVKKRFELDDDSIFLTFNYTTVLESVYGIAEERIMHIHNSVYNVTGNRFFNLSDVDFVLGHSAKSDEYVFYSQSKIGSDKEYIDFRNKTTKDCKKAIKEFNLDNKCLNLQLSNCLKEIVFYGFSFSPADKEYIRLLKMCFPLSSVKYIVYYHVSASETEEATINRLKNNMIKSCLNPNEFEFRNEQGVKKI